MKSPFYNATTSEALQILEESFRSMRRRGIEANYGVLGAAVKQIRLNTLFCPHDTPLTTKVAGIAVVLITAGLLWSFGVQVGDNRGFDRGLAFVHPEGLTDADRVTPFDPIKAYVCGYVSETHGHYTSSTYKCGDVK